MTSLHFVYITLNFGYIGISFAVTIRFKNIIFVSVMYAC